VRLVGYVRESAAGADADSSYAQSDRIRRLVSDGNHSLVALCQDVPRPGLEQGRDGFRAMLGVIDSGQVDGVAVNSLAAFSADLMSQEIMIWDLRRRGAVVVTADESEVDALANPSSDPSRRFVREVLSRLDAYRDDLGHLAPPAAVDLPSPEITIELIDPRRTSSGA